MSMIGKLPNPAQWVPPKPAGHFISEDDLTTFERWLKYQAVDRSAFTPDELAQWQAVFDKIKKSPTPKVGLRKLRAGPGEHLYGVFIREGSDLWLTLWCGVHGGESFSSWCRVRIAAGTLTLAIISTARFTRKVTAVVA
jgi:hypothetical protein